MIIAVIVVASVGGRGSLNLSNGCKKVASHRALSPPPSSRSKGSPDHIYMSVRVFCSLLLNQPKEKEMDQVLGDQHAFSFFSTTRMILIKNERKESLSKLAANKQTQVDYLVLLARFNHKKKY